jgi:hypothetical protein
MTVILNEIIGSGRLRFSADVGNWPPGSYICMEGARVTGSANFIGSMSSSSSLRKPGRNTSSFRNTTHFGFGGRWTQRRCPTFRRSSCRPSSTRAATGYGGARGGATASDLSGCKTECPRYHAGISTAPTTAVLNSRFYETSGYAKFPFPASSSGAGPGTSDGYLGGTVG